MAEKSDKKTADRIFTDRRHLTLIYEGYIIFLSTAEAFEVSIREYVRLSPAVPYRA